MLSLIENIGFGYIWLNIPSSFDIFLFIINIHDFAQRGSVKEIAAVNLIDEEMMMHLIDKMMKKWKKMIAVSLIE